MKGSARMDDPIRRGESGCAVAGCPELGVMLRVTEQGYAVRYCRAHERDAAQMFDRFQEDENSVRN
jgi:hypothetical protein